MKISKTETGLVVEGVYGIKATFRADGTIESELCPRCALAETADEAEELCAALAELRPDFKVAIEALKGTLMVEDGPFVYDLWVETNAYVIYDSYKGQAQRRDAYIKKADWMPDLQILKDEKELIFELTNIAKVPETKAFMRHYVEDINYISTVKWLIDVGFTDPNSILKLLPVAHNYVKDKQDVEWYLSGLIKARGPLMAAKKFLETEAKIPGFVRNLGRELGEIPSEIVEYVLRETSKEVEIWNTLGWYQKNRPLEDEVFVFTKEDERLEGKFGKLTFKLERTAKSLAVLGANMGICVGSYADAVKTGKSKIVAAYDGEKPVACIDCPNGRIYQMKGKFNEPVPKKYQDSVETWVNSNGLTWWTDDSFDEPREGYVRRYDVVDPQRYERHEGPLRIIKGDEWMDITPEYEEEWANEEEWE